MRMPFVYEVLCELCKQHGYRLHRDIQNEITRRGDWRESIEEAFKDDPEVDASKVIDFINFQIYVHSEPAESLIARLIEAYGATHQKIERKTDVLTEAIEKCYEIALAETTGSDFPYYSHILGSAYEKLDGVVDAIQAQDFEKIRFLCIMILAYHLWLEDDRSYQVDAPADSMDFFNLDRTNYLQKSYLKVLEAQIMVRYTPIAPGGQREITERKALEKARSILEGLDQASAGYEEEAESVLFG